MITLSSKTAAKLKSVSVRTVWVSLLKHSRAFSEFLYSPCGRIMDIMKWFLSLICSGLVFLGLCLWFFSVKEQGFMIEKVEAKKKYSCNSWNKLSSVKLPWRVGTWGDLFQGCDRFWGQSSYRLSHCGNNHLNFFFLIKFWIFSIWWSKQIN